MLDWVFKGKLNSENLLKYIDSESHPLISGEDADNIIINDYNPESDIECVATFLDEEEDYLIREYILRVGQRFFAIRDSIYQFDDSLPYWDDGITQASENKCAFLKEVEPYQITVTRYRHKKDNQKNTSKFWRDII